MSYFDTLQSIKTVAAYLRVSTDAQEIGAFRHREYERVCPLGRHVVLSRKSRLQPSEVMMPWAATFETSKLT